MDDVNSRQIDSARQMLFADALVLKTLCNRQALDDLEEVRSSLGPDHGSGSELYSLMHGYKLVVATALYGLLDCLVMHPELLNVDRDDRFQQIWAFPHKRQVIASGSGFTQPQSDFAMVITSIHNLMTQLRIADHWESTINAIGGATPIANALWRSATACTPVPFRNDAAPEINESLRKGAIERLDDYLQDDRFGLTYEFLWMNRNELNATNSWIADEDPFSEVETHSDTVPLLFPKKSPGPKWVSGITAGMSVSISQLVEGLNDRSSTTKLFNELLTSPERMKEILSDEMAGRFHSQEFGLKGLPATEARDVLVSTSSIPYVPPDERLLALVGNEPSVIVSSNPTGALDFPMVMEGMISSLDQDDLIEVLHIKHTKSDGDALTWYSLALRAARFGYFTNFSKWWIFYKGYAVGPMVDSEAVPAERQIKETLDKFVERINLIPLEGIDPATLLSLFEPPVWQYVLEQAKRVNDVNSDLKGVLPELLATALVAHWDCLHIRSCLKPRVLLDLGAEGELDVVAIQPAVGGATCMVLEAKGQSTTDDDLTNELKKFSSKLKVLEQALPELAKELSFDGHLTDLRGIFVSMARLRGFEHGEANVMLWDYDRFREELDQAKIPERLTRQLEPMRIAFRVPETTPSWAAWIESGEET